ncbi:2-oxoacid:acceptor oxidoreductase subunit alpha [Thermicanus aegyptius]|uniref:2-oxoacid:acceptor oxidoreductase subunit alpha n=1 Tax=Thermicanus aegyptius TaxID=94009 RepID=UPI000693D400
MERTWKVGGEQGEGIDSTGEILAKVLNRTGHYIFAYRSFMSLIKGGHTYYKIRIRDRPVHYHGDQLDILLAFDQLTIEMNWSELHDGSLIIYDDSKKGITPKEDKRLALAPIPLTHMAKELGNEIVKNMVACGASAAAMDLSLTTFEPVIEELFAKKGEKVVELNRQALRKGFEYYRENFRERFPLPPRGNKKLALVSGNEMTGLGALLGGCRFLAAYPITPATEIMYWMLRFLPNYGGRVVQAEDEIAACIMAIGANYAGVRAATSTSGPGFSLMQEAIGLAGMTETPLVIIDVQRGGPGTGLPTKTEQSDLNEMLYGSHGEIPRIVLIPSTIEESLHFTFHAFELAEKYQCPVIVGTDLYLGMSKKSSDSLDLSNYQVKRHSMVTQEELDRLEKGEYKRYNLGVENGISPRSIPGQRNGRYVALSNEHDEGDVEIEDPDLRRRMFDKRLRKLAGFDFGPESIEWIGEREGDLLLVCFGSPRVQLEEALDRLLREGRKAGLLILKVVKPFPAVRVKPYLERAKEVLVVENNGTGQLAQLLRQEVGHHDKIKSLLRYDGVPFTVQQIVDAVQGEKEALYHG